MEDININKSVTSENEIGTVSIEGFCNHPSLTFNINKPDYHAPVYIGETLKYDVVIKRANKDEGAWKLQIVQIAGQATIVPSTFSSTVSGDTPDSSQNRKIADSKKTTLTSNESFGLVCPVLATFFGTSSQSSSLTSSGLTSASMSLEHDSSCKPYFRDDSTYIIPMSSCLQDLSGDCHYVELRVVLWLNSIVTNPSDSGTSAESDLQTKAEAATNNEVATKKKILVDIKEFFDSAPGDGTNIKHARPVGVPCTFHTIQEKIVTKKLRVQGPPELRVRQMSAGQKQLLLLSVNNTTDKQMVIKSIQILSSSSPVLDVGISYEDGSIKWESCHQLISLEVPKRSLAFPVILSPCEDLNLIYRLHLSSIPSDSELSLRANVKWTHAGASHEITTLYKLPRIRIRCPPFIITVKCDEEVVLGKTFFVTFSISNQLHDFMSMRLYYNLENMYRNMLENGGSPEEMSRIQHLKDSIICHDPDIAGSSCPRGSCMPHRVGFQIHKPGLYELSELMKVNLRYSLPDTQLSPVVDESGSSSSDTSISFQSTDDHLLASEELWRDRSGSTASLATPIMFQTAEERRRSFASKSYSFGDLGPTVSAESDEVAGNARPKVIKRSSAVPPPRPPPPRLLSQSEKDLIKPSNFLKQPFYIYVKDLQML
ncbi:uncharacterized protein LOC131943990 [Physella acuta]|uniref:uncharacterized protein LOC131943990 n=1 Tax=Physella acuta TaxID=109671 RepID=UPI0027DB99C3|nr:uncharacterized protein LOC131943990 [Physella acuta]